MMFDEILSHYSNGEMFTLTQIQSLAVFLWHKNGVCRCLACAYGLRGSHDRGWVESRCNRAKIGATVLTLWYEPLRGKQATLKCKDSPYEICVEWAPWFLRRCLKILSDDRRSRMLEVLVYLSAFSKKY